MDNRIEGVMNALEHLEKLIYKILLWVLLIPKTVIQITLFPRWAPGYIDQELGEGSSRFDEYMSPVVLLLVVALLPGVLANFLPSYGVDITSPQIAAPDVSRNVHFEAKAKFISAATTDNYSFSWYVQQGVDDGKGNFAYSTQETPTLWHTDDPDFPKNYMEFNNLDARTVTDSVDFPFPNSGTYRVFVEVSKVGANNSIIEQYTSDDVTVIVPSDFAANVLVSSYSANTAETSAAGATNAQGSIITRASENAGKQTSSLLDQLKSENTLFLALALLIPPLIFALAVKLFTGAKISEDLLKNTFYVQCYYFVPITLSIWATYYAYYFYTSDIFHSDLGFAITILPPLLALIWFWEVETNAVAEERHISPGRARLIVLLCLGIILFGGILLLFRNQPDVQDTGRKFAIWFYPLASFVLLGFVGRAWIRGIQADKKKLALGQWITILGFLFVIGCCLLGSFVVGSTPFTVPTILPTETQTPAATSTILPTEAAQATQALAVTEVPAQVTQAVDLSTPVVTDKRFYTEDFSGALDSWKSFVIDGSSNQVRVDTAAGNFRVQLKQDGDTKPAAYFINEAFTYTDVHLQVVTTNNGNNGNGVSLICRYSDKGWYEFEVSNSGLYWIYEYDAASNQFNQLAAGGSPAIQAGPSQNTYVAICQGNTVTLYINDQPIESITDAKLTDGQIGFGVLSLQGLPVDVKINSLEVSQP